MATVRLTGLAKNYDRETGLKRLDLETRDGEFRVIFGPAGAGKTTTLNLIAGIVPPTAGSVHIGGRCMDSVDPASRNIAMVFESYALYPHMKVFDNIAFPLRSPRYRQSEAEIRERVTRLAETMKISHLLDRKIQELSNGQRQRTALGRALIREPDVFLLDEPLSHLDAKLRHSMRAEFKEMKAQMETTTFYVTHDYLEALSLADQITVLSDGQVLQEGTPDEVFLSPASAEVARLFGDPEINLFPCELTGTGRGGAGLRLFASGEVIPLPDKVPAMLPNKSGSLLLGVRPSDLRIGEYTDGPGYPARVYSFEPLGIHAVLTLDLGDDWPHLRALVPVANRYAPDETVMLSFRRDAFLLFDPDSGTLLTRSGTHSDFR